MPVAVVAYGSLVAQVSTLPEQAHVRMQGYLSRSKKQLVVAQRVDVLTPVAGHGRSPRTRGPDECRGLAGGMG